MEQLVITYNTILAFFGAVAVIGGGIKLIVGLLSPFKELKDRLDRHDKLFRNDDERLKSIESGLERIEEGQKIQGKAMMELLNHVISGNDIDKLKEQHSDLMNFYIDK